ncbi:MAG: HEPN domain-containing protein [Desulfococcaceae bacterium]
MKDRFLKKAMENLRAAEICCEEGLYNACANRLYYSVFQAAIAALLHSGITRDKFEHKQVQADFSGELIRKRKIYPAKFKSYLSDMQTVRNRADYHGDDVSRQKSERRLSEAKEMVEWIKREVGK